MFHKKKELTKADVNRLFNLIYIYIYIYQKHKVKIMAIVNSVRDDWEKQNAIVKFSNHNKSVSTLQEPLHNVVYHKAEKREILPMRNLQKLNTQIIEPNLVNVNQDRWEKNTNYYKNILNKSKDFRPQYESAKPPKKLAYPEEAKQTPQYATRVQAIESRFKEVCLPKYLEQKKKQSCETRRPSVRINLQNDLNDQTEEESMPCQKKVQNYKQRIGLEKKRHSIESLITIIGERNKELIASKLSKEKKSQRENQRPQQISRKELHRQSKKFILFDSKLPNKFQKKLDFITNQARIVQKEIHTDSVGTMGRTQGFILNIQKQFTSFRSDLSPSHNRLQNSIEQHLKQ